MNNSDLKHKIKLVGKEIIEEKGYLSSIDVLRANALKAPQRDAFLRIDQPFKVTYSSISVSISSIERLCSSKYRFKMFIFAFIKSWVSNKMLK